MPTTVSLEPAFYTTCGILIHSSLAITVEVTPLGLCASRFWTRASFKGTDSLKRSVNPTRIPIEKKESIRWVENLRLSIAQLAVAERCVPIGDRESDIFELFCAARDEQTYFLFRTCADRLCGPDKRRVSEEMESAVVCGRHPITFQDKDETSIEVDLEIKYERLGLDPPVGKRKAYQPITATVIHAKESGSTAGREPVDWKLVTDLPIEGLGQAVEKLRWYAMRWKIETFHKILKSGCRAEDSKLRTVERLANLLSIFCLLAWRVFWLTMPQRSAEEPG